MDQEIKSNFQAVKPGGLKKFIKIYLLVFAGLVLFTFGLWTGEASTKNTVDGAKDPYTVFLHRDIPSDFTQELTGSFSGIGSENAKKNYILVIIAPLDH